MQQSISAAVQLLAPNGWLAILTTTTGASSVESLAAASSPIDTGRFAWQPHHPLPAGTDRILLQGQLA